MRIEVHKRPEEESEADEAREDWVGHAYTEKMRQDFKKSADGALKELLSKCSLSEDANVRGAYERYTSLMATHVLLTKGK